MSTDSIVSDTFDRSFFYRLSTCTNDAQKSLFLAEHVWPGVAQALADLASSASKDNPLRYIAQRLMRNKAKVAASLPKEWDAWIDRERGMIMWSLLKEDVRQVFEGFTIRRQVRLKDFPKIFSAIDDSLCLDSHFSQTSFALDSLPASVDFATFWDFITSQTQPGGKLLKKAASTRALRRAVTMENAELREAEAEEAAKSAARAAEAVRPWLELISRMNENENLLKIKTKAFFLTGSPFLATPREVPVEGNHVSLIAQALRLLGFCTLNKQNERVEENPTVWTLALSRQWAAAQRACRCSVTDGIVDTESLCTVVHAEFNALREKVLASWAEWVATEEGAAEAHGLPGGLSLALSGVNVESEDEGKPSFKLISLRTGISLIRLNWLHEQFISLLEDGVDNYPDNPSALSKDEMCELIEQLQPDITAEEFEVKFKQVDSDGSGQIEFDEFVEWMAAGKLELDESENPN